MPRVSSIRVGTNHDGRLELFAIDRAGVAYHKSQRANGAAGNQTWSEWRSLAGVALRECEVANDADGRLEFLVRGRDGGVYRRAQAMPNGDWTEWEGLGGSLLNQFTVGSLQDGSLQIFAVGGDKLVYSKRQAGPNGAWGDWTLFAGNLPVATLTAGKNADGRLEIFALDVQGVVYHRWESGGGWSDWSSLQGHDITQLVVGQNQDGRMELFALGGDGAAYHVWQLAPNDGWSGWAGGLGSGSVRQLAVERDAVNILQLFLLNASGSVARLAQASPNNGWEQSASDLQGNRFIQLAVARNSRQRLELFAVCDDGTVWHRFQDAGLNWGGWMPIDVGEGPEAFTNPQLTEAQNLLQRGGDPDPPHHDAGPAAPTYKSDPNRRANLQNIFLPSIIGSHRFRQDLLLPYLLIRGFPGDHGIRPIPPGSILDKVHPESPDIIVVPGEPQQVPGLEGQTPTLEPGPGPHTIFVRVWNLGLLPAIGVTLSVHEIHLDEVEDTGFTFYSAPVLIAQGFFDLPDCYSAGCRAVIKISRPWVPTPSATSTQTYARYLIAKVSCFADRASDSGDSFSDRHVAGRGLLS